MRKALCLVPDSEKSGANLCRQVNFCWFNQAVPAEFL